MANNDYRLEELENAAVNKSNNAKRIAAAAGLLAAGGSAGAAAGMAISHPHHAEANIEEVDELGTEEMDATLDAAANQVQEHQSEPQQQPVNNGGNGGHTPSPKGNDVDVSFNKSTNYYDENGNLVMQSEDGKVNGHNFTVVDYDADGKGDLLAIDANGNGIYDDDEIYALEGNDKIDMGNASHYHEDVYLTNNTTAVEEEDIEPYNIYDEKDVAQNTPANMAEEKEGDIYSGENETEQETEEDYYVAQQENEEETTSYDDLGPDMDIV